MKDAFNNNSVRFGAEQCFVPLSEMSNFARTPASGRSQGSYAAPMLAEPSQNWWEQALLTKHKHQRDATGC